MDDNAPSGRFSLHHLTREYLQYLNTVEEAAKELSGEISPACEQALEQAEKSLARKVDACDFIMAKLNAEASFYEARAAEMEKYAKACLNAKERLEGRIVEALIETPGGVLQGEEAAFKLATSQGSVQVLSESLIPSNYKKTTVAIQVDKTRIREDLKAGVDVPGATLVHNHFARRVRPKK